MQTRPALRRASRRARSAGLVVAWTVALLLLGFALAEPLFESLANEPAAVEPAPLRPGWGRVVVGLPSGAEPIERPRPTLAPLEEELDTVPPTEVFELIAPADFELVVPSGAVLSRIVQAHYGTIQGGLVDLVARYNGLASPDDLAAGQKLYLPSHAVLLEASGAAAGAGGDE